MNPFHNIDPALLDNSTTPNPLTNQFISQDGSTTDVPAACRSGSCQTQPSVHMGMDAPLAPCNTTGPASVNYGGLNLQQLKAQCKAQGLKVGGKKAELVGRLENNDRQQVLSIPDLPPCSPAPSVDLGTSRMGPPRNNPLNSEAVEIDSAQVLAESIALDNYFQHGFRQEMDADEAGESEDGEDEQEEVIDDEEDSQVDNPRTRPALAWADKFILETRRKGGRQTESSVLKLWKTWACEAINSGLLPDIIVDSNHMIEYLKYAATRQLFNRQGKKRSTSSRLSSSSLKKIMTMLGRVRRRQEDENPEIRVSRPAKNSRTEDFYKAVMVQSQQLRLESGDFDITKGTILDSELRPEQFNEVTSAIFQKLDLLPSIVKAHFAWTWQCSTLNRSDEVISLLMACIQPFCVRLPHHTAHNGQISPLTREVFGVLGLFHETKTAQPGKTEPKYSFVLPHRNPLRCPVGAIAILLHFMFDQGKLASRIPTWNWEDAATWRKVHVLFGRTVDQMSTGDGLGKMYSNFLSHTSITSNKKTHLARRSLPGVLEEMGVPADQVDASGHWQGNTWREIYGSKIPKAAVVALAGFPVGETYFVPWAQVKVPDALQKQIFPFCEDVLARLRIGGCENQGTINFLELLQHLQPFFWRAISSIQEHFPDSGVIKRLNILSKHDAALFFQQWPTLRGQEEAKNVQLSVLRNAFHETPTREAFSSFAAQIHGMNQFMESTVEKLSVLTRRTEPFSPSKHGSQTMCSFNYHPPLNISPRILFPSALPETPISSLSPSPPTPSSSSESFPPNSPPSDPLSHPQPLTLQSAQIVTSNSSQVYPSTSGLSSNILRPTTISASNQQSYHVLPLSPLATLDQHLIHTAHDLVLPPASAFLSSMYPVFTTVDCTWQYVLDRVVNPSPLWSSYAPGSLGDFADVKAIWQAWDEGTYIKDVGRKPALRLIDARWGNLESQETHKRKFPSWRPRNDDKARKIWSNFYFFIHRIDARIKSGQSSDEAVKYFEDLQGMKSLSQLHKTLQPRKRKQATDDNNELQN